MSGDARDFAIPLVWPRQKITVPEAYRFHDVVPEHVSIFGHAGIVIVKGETGFTRYFEYGRFGGSSGKIRPITIPNVKFVDRAIFGKAIEKGSLENLLSKLPHERGAIMGTVLKASKNGFEDALTFIEDEGNGFRRNYKLANKNCYHFTQSVSNAMGTTQDLWDGLVSIVPATEMNQLISKLGGFYYSHGSGLREFDSHIK